MFAAKSVPNRTFHKPRVALTMGDPAGIGPEVIVGAWGNEALQQVCRPFVVGHPEIVRRAIALYDLPAEVVLIDHPEQAAATADLIPCLPVGDDNQLDLTPGTIDARGGQAAYDSVVYAAKLALAGSIDAMTTGPLHKEALHAAGHDYPGHTELLADLCHVPEVGMMLYLPHGPTSDGATVMSPAGLGVVHVTLHMALREVFHHLSVDAIVAKTHLAADVMQRLKGSPPRIAVAALNPHAGEGGLFGDEEITLIRPAVEQARSEGINVAGPIPVDTLMGRARDGEFDGVVAMYHDQGHIALKLLGMHEAVNITLGLPIIRTSVAHGTAFDRAWQGRSETTGLVAAVQVAAQLATGRTKTESPTAAATTLRS